MTDKLIIFDMDGTLFDTAQANYLAYQTALQEQGFSLDRARFIRECSGKYYQDFLRDIMENASEEMMERVHERKKELYASFLGDVRENRLLFEMLRALKPRFYTALVTTASRVNCMQLLRRFGRESLFDLILTREDVARVKPDPEGFRKAMDHFHVDKANTMVFEDSPDGLEAARRCGAGAYKTMEFICLDAESVR